MVNSNASIEMQLLSRRKAAKMVVVVVIVYAVCYFPVHVIAILRYCTLHLLTVANNLLLAS
jgi:hypocretin (orexin) receptor 2